MKPLIAGFTLVELLAVLALLSILAMGVAPLAEMAQTRERERELRLALREIRAALDAYKLAVDRGDVARRPEGAGFPARLDDLVNGVDDARQLGKRHYFLRRLPRDPFGPEDVPAAATWGLRSYASPPLRPTPGDDVFDVYSQSARVGLNGVPLRQW